MNDIALTVVGFALWGLLIAAYFLPLICAAIRKRENILAIGILNLLAGWTFVGWIVALVMACSPNRAPAAVVVVGGAPHWSPDGRYFWDGSSWIAPPPPPQVTS